MLSSQNWQQSKDVPLPPITPKVISSTTRHAKEKNVVSMGNEEIKLFVICDNIPVFLFFGFFFLERGIRSLRTVNFGGGYTTQHLFKLIEQYTEKSEFY